MPGMLRGLSLFLTMGFVTLSCGDSNQPLTSNLEPDASGTSTKPQLGDDRYSAEVNPTGNPIGGGEGYTLRIFDYDFLVNTREELVNALELAGAAQIVYVADSAHIDLTGLKDLPLRGGVTLASGRGTDGSEGGWLYSNELDTLPLFKVSGSGVRVTGLRIQGPDTLRRTEQMAELSRQDNYYSIPNSRGIQTTHPQLQVDNCELWGWSHAAVFLQKGATDNHIHHNYMHHNQRHGLGYGVVLDQSEALIEANLFDWGRHHIAGTGRPGTSYEARYNRVMENANSHSFDMHGGRDRDDGTDIAGDLILIHHNTFQARDVAAVVIRGIPQESAEIYNNWFLHATPSTAVKQTNATGNLRTYKNQYTEGRVLKD
jgi:hypothetical protein